MCHGVETERKEREERREGEREEGIGTGRGGGGGEKSTFLSQKDLYMDTKWHKHFQILNV